MPIAPADTLNYMLGGYAVIFGVMAVYLVSFVVRWRNLREDEQTLEEVEAEEKAKK